jgi:hypothetical protein
MAQQTFQEKKGEGKRLRRQLIKVRQEGLDGFNPDQVLDLRAIARRLIAEGSDQERIKALLELAIAHFSEVETKFGTEATSEAARLWFGLDPATRDKDHLKRHEAAAGHLGQKVRRFENEYASEILKRLVTLLVRLDNEQPSPDEEPTGKIDSAAPAPSHGGAEEEAQAKPRHSRRRAAGLIAVTVLAVVLISWALVVLFMRGIAFFSHEPSTHLSKTSTPPPGTVIDAATGGVAHHIDRHTNRQDAYLSGGESFRACDLTTETKCAYNAQKPPAVSDGDVVEIGIMLYNPGESPVPYATLFVIRSSMVSSTLPRQSSIQLNLTINWPEATGLKLSPIREELNLPAASPRDGYISLAYIPGSTVLTNRKHHFIARLPDGIMEGGLALASLGSPASCFDCGTEYIRFVFFKARVGAVRHKKP